MCLNLPSIKLAHSLLLRFRENNTPEMQMQWAQYPGGLFRKPKFPWIEALVLAPCACAAAAGIKVPFQFVFCMSCLHDIHGLHLPVRSMPIYAGDFGGQNVCMWHPRRCPGRPRRSS